MEYIAIVTWVRVTYRFPSLKMVAENNIKMLISVYQTTCNETGVQLDKNHWYEHIPKYVEKGQGGKVTILWNQQVQTDRTIPNNKPDIIRDNEKRTRMLIDVAIYWCLRHYVVETASRLRHHQFLLCGCTYCTVHIALYILHCTYYTVHIALYILHCTYCTVHIALYILHCTYCTVRIAPYTLHCTYCTVHIALYILHCTSMYSTSVFLKMNPRIWIMYKISWIKIIV